MKDLSLLDAIEARAMCAYRMSRKGPCDFASTHEMDGASFAVVQYRGLVRAVYRLLDDGGLVVQKGGRFVTLIKGLRS